MFVPCTLVSLALLAKLAMAGPSAWFYDDFGCTDNGHPSETWVEHKIDKIGAECLPHETDKKALYVSGAGSDNTESKPYCMYLSEGPFCDGNTTAMELQGKNFCYAYQTGNFKYKSYRIVKDACWDTPIKVVPHCIKPYARHNTNCVKQWQTVDGV